MAQPKQTLHFICRSCQNTLFRPSSITTSIRTFTNSSTRSKSIPAFQPTSVPAMDELLLDWRNRVFTPSALSTHHQTLIYRPKHKAILENDPGVGVTMSNDEEVKLVPIQRWDRPSKHKDLVKLANILGENREISVWENLAPFLEGMKIANERIPVEWLEKVTRKANEVERAGIVKRCAEMAEKTGVRLSLKPVTRELVLGLHARAAEVKFKGDTIPAICKEAESLAMMLEREDHCGGKLKDGHVDMRRDLVVIGVLLELSAAKALEVHGGKDVDGSVSGYMRKLLALEQNDVLHKDEGVTSSRAIEQWLPIAQGIKMASKIEGTGIASNDSLRLRAMAEKLNKAIDKEAASVRESAQGKPRRSLTMLEKIRQS